MDSGRDQRNKRGIEANKSGKDSKKNRSWNSWNEGKTWKLYFKRSSSKGRANQVRSDYSTFWLDSCIHDEDSRKCSTICNEAKMSSDD